MSSATSGFFCCPFCGVHTAYESMFSHVEDHGAFDGLLQLMLPGLATELLRYLALHAPAKNRLSMPRKRKLLAELLTDLQRAAVHRKGRDWAAPAEHWARAIDQMVTSAADGRLKLPLTGHAYLHEILVGMAEKAEAAQERAVERDRRQAPRRDTVLVQGVPTTLGDALEQTYGARDPELVKAEQANRNAAPVPEAVRQRLSQLKKGE
ncbi:hypothetical protein [Pseudacidovorax intermedius]|uniref:hypothetical protein n=1 Tax=Pseudacidovorax intermedius TaxID=433924 RepID=UPI0026EC2523|nr:hypothetical protein [Pseudacidovorax intermedius]